MNFKRIVKHLLSVFIIFQCCLVPEATAGNTLCCANPSPISTFDKQQLKNIIETLSDNTTCSAMQLAEELTPQPDETRLFHYLKALLPKTSPSDLQPILNRLWDLRDICISTTSGHSAVRFNGQGLPGYTLSMTTKPFGLLSTIESSAQIRKQLQELTKNIQLLAEGKDSIERGLNWESNLRHAHSYSITQITSYFFWATFGGSSWVFINIDLNGEMTLLNWGFPLEQEQHYRLASFINSKAEITRYLDSLFQGVNSIRSGYF